MTRCLVLNCSKSKKPTNSKVHAIDLYDGPAFRVLRLFLHNAQAYLLDIDIYILSAKHGLIFRDTFISNYDEHITPEKADQINAQVLEQLSAIFKKGYSEIFALISKDYLRAIQGYEEFLISNSKWSISTVSEGKRLRVLKSWLYNSDNYYKKPIKQIKVTGHAVLKGHYLETGPEGIIPLALKALEEGQGSPYNFRDWYVIVDNKRLSSKWLVSLLTGLDVSEFQADDARRVLTQLGVKVNHL